MSNLGTGRTFVFSHLDPATEDRIRRKRSDCKWVYLGKNIQKHYHLKQTLADIEEIPIGADLMDAIAHRIRHEFIDLDSQLHMEISRPLWQTLDLAERSPYSSDLFFNCCVYFAFDRIRTSFTGGLVVIAESWGLGRCLARRSKALGYHATHHSGNKVWVWLPSWVSVAVHRGRQIYRALQTRVTFVRRVLQWKRNAQGLHKPGADDRDLSRQDTSVLLVTWAGSATFPPSGPKRTDTFLGEFPGAFSDRGLKVRYLAIPVDWSSSREEILENLRDSSDTVILPQQCLEWKDVASIVLRTLRKPWRSGSRFVIDGHDLTMMLEEEAWNEKTKLRQCWAMQYYYVAKYLSRKGIQPRVVLHPYENQPWEKGLRLGVKRYLPDTKVAAYLHAPFAPLWLAFFPSHRDLAASQIPDRIVVLGPVWNRLFEEHGYPHDCLIPGPSFRYAYLFGEGGHRAGPATGNANRVPTLLVASHGLYRDSFELTAKTIQAFQATPQVKVLIKFHPTIVATGRDQLIQEVLIHLGLTKLPDHIEVSATPIAELLRDVDLVLHNGTSVALEAAAWGIPTLYVQSDLWFSMDILAFSNGLGSRAGQPDEICELALSLLNLDMDLPDRTNRARDFLNDYFSPTDPALLRGIVDLTLGNSDTSPRSGETTSHH